MTSEQLGPRRVSLAALDLDFDLDASHIRGDVDEVLIADAPGGNSIDELLYPGRSAEFQRHMTRLVLNDVLMLAREYSSDSEPRSILGVLATKSSMTLGELVGSTERDVDSVADALVGLCRLGLVDQEAGSVEPAYRLTARTPEIDYRFVVDETLSA